ncbi:OLC1v1027110C1 [Oldenlandia corymbosa var. corymbosa]|uniref:OLC1v1027110C1 n=1 Tax=Oldenlandia corymbosa var. corymbosa TaxID=529605 RepID=A0AAV1C9F4_OLDCO|nr:OLC1v1027110C1 [Oldenlandia corymbosa var. corymbosa]
MKQKHKLALIVGLPVLGVIIIILFLMASCCRRKTEEIGSKDIETNFEFKEREGTDKEDLIRFHGAEDLTAFDILEAPGEVIGKSSYGSLYRANLLRSNSLALLRFVRPTCTLRIKEVVPIVELLGSLRHPNLVPLLAFYAGSRGEKLLVYPFYPWGTLAELIRDGNGEAHRWPIIHKVSIGIASGLSYLHNDLEMPVIHGNIKSKNVMLDRHYQPFLSDVGLHLLLNTAAAQQMLEASAAEGYKAPELIKMKDVNEESDIYGFGVILLELLTGKDPIDENPTPDQDFHLPNAIRTAILDDQIRELYHPEIIRGQSSDERALTEDRIFRMFQLAMACCSPSPSLRPDMKQIVSKLEEIGN